MGSKAPHDSSRDGDTPQDEQKTVEQDQSTPGASLDEQSTRLHVNA